MTVEPRTNVCLSFDISGDAKRKKRKGKKDTLEKFLKAGSKRKGEEGETRVEKWYREGKVEEEEEEEEDTRGLRRGDDFLERKSRLELDNCPIHGFLNFVLFSFVALGKRDVARDSRNFSLL